MKGFIQVLLYLFWIHILPSSDNHVLIPTHNAEVSLFIEHSQVTRIHPSILDRFFISHRIFPISIHDGPSLNNKFPRNSNRTCFSIFINYFTFQSFDDGSNCLGFMLKGVCRFCLETHWRCFSHSITISNFFDSQGSQYFLHQNFRC